MSFIENLTAANACVKHRSQFSLSHSIYFANMSVRVIWNLSTIALHCRWYRELVSCCILSFYKVSLMISFRFFGPLSVASYTRVLYQGNTSVEIKFATVCAFLSGIAYATYQLVNLSTKPQNNIYSLEGFSIWTRNVHTHFLGGVTWDISFHQGGSSLSPVLFFGIQDRYLPILILLYITWVKSNFYIARNFYQLPCVPIFHGTIPVSTRNILGTINCKN